MDPVDLELAPGSTRFDPADERWLRQVQDLAQELQKAGLLQQRSTPEPGTKGALDQLILSLGSGGAFAASVEIVKSWLSRDRGRTLVVKYFENGQTQAIELSGSVADEAAFARIQSHLENQRNDQSKL